MSGTITRKLLIGSGAASAVLRTGYLVVLGVMTPGYSHLVNFNSELSAIGAPYLQPATLLLYVVGALTIAFGIGVFRFMKDSGTARAGAVMITASGLAFIGIAAFPCDPGCSLAAPSTTMKLHMLAGFSAMSLQTLAMVTVGFHRSDEPGSAFIRKISRVLGAVGVVSMAWLYSAYFGLGGNLPHPAIAQKGFTLASDAWLFLLSLTLLRSRS